MGRCRPTLKAPEKEGLRFAERVLTLPRKVFFKAIEKGFSWFVKMLDRKFNFGLSEEQENAPQRDTKGIERAENGGAPKVSVVPWKN